MAARGAARAVGFAWEPVAISEVVRQAMYLALLFDIVKWTDAQQQAVTMFVSALLSALTRSVVTSEHTLEAAGTSKTEVVAMAAANAAGTPPNGPTGLGLGMWLLVLLGGGLFASACGVYPGL